MTIQTMSPRRRLWAAVSALGFCASLLGFVGSQAHGEVEYLGKHSAFTREELRTNWPGAERFPLLVPARLPPGAETHPEIGFSLDNVVTDPVRDASKRVWLSYYESDVLGDLGTSFRIFQRPVQVPSGKPCGPVGDVPFVQRRIGSAVVTICSSAVSSGSPARKYWAGVTFTSDLESVEWLRGVRRS